MTNYVIQVKQVQTCSSSKSREEMYQRQERTVLFETFAIILTNIYKYNFSQKSSRFSTFASSFFLGSSFFTVFMNGLLSVCGEFFVNSRTALFLVIFTCCGGAFPIRSNRSYPCVFGQNGLLCGQLASSAFAFITGFGFTGSKPNGSTVVTGYTTGFFTWYLILAGAKLQHCICKIILDLIQHIQ
ncbi:Hypothetical_protein [Hexamita inflata]|uniref:Hypothetical_protein n=1 Tax=Hexamita inflata TaxID=28002 RepID=A0AA86TN15_9EUKA|nr:Hypothetical protein HINF_LOCUS9915 [Hexamita inflata]